MSASDFLCFTYVLTTDGTGEARDHVDRQLVDASYSWGMSPRDAEDGEQFARAMGAEGVMDEMGNVL